MVKTDHQTGERRERLSLQEEVGRDLRAPVDVPDRPLPESPEPSVIGRIRSRRRTAQLRSCPRCLEPSLVPTGVYWACASCRFAITEQALSRELLGSSSESEQAPLATGAGRAHR
jgi:hypothetical protein